MSLSKILYNYHLLDSLFFQLKEFVQEGVTELDVYHFCCSFLSVYSNTLESFECCIGGGINSWHSDHQPTTRSLQSNECLMVDIFPSINGYYCDITRCFFVGTCTDQRILATKIAAVFDQIPSLLTPNTRAQDIDHMIRNEINKICPGYTYTHHTGHGIGKYQMQVPIIDKTSSHVLSLGDVIAIEPAIYIPDQFGIRLENTYLVTSHGGRCLNQVPLII